MVWPNKGAGFGLYKPRPNIKTGLVYQVDARVLLRCLKQNPNPFRILWIPVFYLNISLLDYFSGLFFPFFVYLVLWIFGFLGALVYILHCGQSFWHCK